MNTLVDDKPSARATAVHLTADSLAIDLSDGRSISIPLARYPRLLQGTRQERENHRFIGTGEGIHWPDLDENISIENVLAGKPSGESQKSLQEWLLARTKR